MKITDFLVSKFPALAIGASVSNPAEVKKVSIVQSLVFKLGSVVVISWLTISGYMSRETASGLITMLLAAGTITLSTLWSAVATVVTTDKIGLPIPKEQE